MMETVDNLYSLIIVLIGVSLCFAYHVSHARRAYQLLSAVFLGDFLSCYYWAVFTFVMGENPESSALLAYFGWNLGYVMLFLFVRHMQTAEEKRFFHPLILLPIPFGIAQFLLYSQFGGIFNNAWQGIFDTAILMMCIQTLLYRRKQKETAGKRDRLFVLILLFVIFRYGMYTISCFDWPSEVADPFYYFSIIDYTLMLFLPAATAGVFGDRIRSTEKNEESDFRNGLRILFVALILGISLAGAVLANWMKSLMETGAEILSGDSVSRIIMMALFIISAVLSILVVSIMMVLSYGKRRLDAMDQGEAAPSDKDPVSVRSKEGENTAEEGISSYAAGKRAVIRRWNLILPLLITFILIVLVIIFTSRMFYRVSVSNIFETATDKTANTSVHMEKYLDTAKSVLWVTADSVDHMMQKGEPEEEILAYLTEETENQQVQFDENYTGIYGYIDGTYLDGAGWVPPAGYDPTTRDWYLAAAQADREITIAAPYVDAQTGSVVISICRLLSDGKSALALDLLTNYIQKIAEETDVNDKGFCFVLDRDGTVIAHRDPSMNGTDITGQPYGDELLEKTIHAGNGNFEMVYEGEEHTIFVDDVMNQWYIVIVIGNRELYAEVYSALAVNVVTFLIVFLLIAFFYAVAYRNEERSNREAEALKIREQKQSYEAEILRLEKSAADAANQAKSSFLADMSHEIRTPINAVLGMNEMILREATDENIRTYAGNVESAGRNLLSIINDILDFSKIEAGKMEIAKAPYRLSSVLNDVSNMIMFRARAKDLAFHVKVDETIPDELHGDEVRVRQVITNILTNAVKYTKEGSVTLTVNAEKRTEDLDLIVAVTDTGIGIRPEDQEKLFQKFGRVDLQQTNTIEGTGLGLAITGNLLQLMEGDISVQSTYGEGSTFTIRFPQGIVSTEPIGDFHKKFEQSLKERKAYQESFRAPEAQILVVDDTRMNLTVMKGLLKKTEVQLDTATGGEEALGKTRERAYDLILLDQRMPGMDGTETLKHIRAQETGLNQDTPVICLTADAVQGARERYLREGFTDYLSKPVEASELEAALKKYLPPEKIR